MSAAEPKVLLIEFNELCPTLMDQFIADGDLPNFKALKERSANFITNVDVETSENLEPWIQWYSLHTGLPFEEHGVFHLTDGPKAPHKDLFQVMLENDMTVGCGGSMNVKGFAAPGSFFIADPWCAGQKSYPESLAVFQDFVAAQVREYSNPEGDNADVTPLQFASFMARNGLSSKTIASIVKQLSEEKIVDGHRNWKRPTILDRLNVDLFSALYRRYQPRFATFFSNSTAHLQHTYWRSMDPDAFQVKPGADEIDRYKGAIRHGYKSMDKYLPELLKLVGPEDTVIFATALSQQPYLKKEGMGGQRFYRPRAIETLLAELDIAYDGVEPTMTHQFMLRTSSPEAAVTAMDALKMVRIDNKNVFGFTYAAGSTDVYFGAELSGEIDPGAIVVDGRSGKSMRFGDYFYKIDGLKSGCHHPDGMLWIAGPDVAAAPALQERVSILDVFPTVLTQLGLAAEIPADRTGTSLLPAPTSAGLKMTG